MSNTAPSALAAANTPRPANAVCESVSFTPPRSSAGMASTGIASSIANTSTLIAVSAVTVAAGWAPERTRILYCSAEPTAPPPGATLASPLPASCDVITARQRGPCSVTNCNAHSDASDAACSPAIASSDHSEKRVICFHEPNTSTMLGNTR